MTEAEIEQAARDAFHSDLDWSDEGNLLASAVQRAYFRQGAKWALAQSRSQPSSEAVELPLLTEKQCTWCGGRGFYGTPGARCNWCDGKGSTAAIRAAQPPAAPTVEQAIAALVDALAESKGWMRTYADAIIRDAIDRKPLEVSAPVGGQGGPLLQCDIVPRPLRYPLSDYHKAPAEGPLNFTWIDKPHRLLYDLIAAVQWYATPPTEAQGQAQDKDVERLLKAAQAVIDRWDTPLWKDVPATAVYISELCAAIDAAMSAKGE